MRKIPTVYVRDPDDLSRVTEEVHPDCAWVFAGEGVATRKYDGTCVLLDPGTQEWWARREVKPESQHVIRVDLAHLGWEGVVWHHPDGRMAKIKARDIGIVR